MMTNAFDEVELNYILEAIQERKHRIENGPFSITSVALRSMAVTALSEIEQKIFRALDENE